MPQNYKNQPSINRFNFARWYQDKNLLGNAEFAIGSGNNFTSWTKTIPTHTNLQRYSQDFSNGFYNNIGFAVTADNITGPDGTLTADKMVENISDGSHRSEFGITGFVNGINYTQSIYVKKGTRNYFYIFFFGDNGVFVDSQVWFNISNGTIGTIDSGITATIEDAGNGWYRCIATRTAENSATGYIGLGSSIIDNQIGYAGTTSDYTFYWGAQLETGSKATKYIPTTSAAVTADDGQIVAATRTNMFLNSQDFDNSTWQKARGAITANTTIAPDGTTTADTFAYTSGGIVPALYTQYFTYVSNTKYTLSIYAKILGDTNIISLEYSDISPTYTGGGATFNLSTETIINYQPPNNSLKSAIEKLNNGWYRLSISFVANSSTNFSYIQISINSTSTSNQVAFWGAQLEVNEFPTDYIHTISAAVTVNDGVNSTRAVRLDRGVTSGLAINQASVLGDAGDYKLSFWAKKATIAEPAIKVLSEITTFDTIAIDTTYFKKYEIVLPALSPDNQIALYNDVENTSVVIDNARLEIVQEGVTIGATQPYLMDPGRMSFPILAPTDNFQFYINNDTPITGLTKSDLVPVIYNDKGIREYAWTTSVLSEITFGEGKQYYSSQLDLSVLSTLPEGLYYVAIYNTSTGNVLYTSNYLYLRQTDYDSISSHVKFRHYKSIFRVDYTTLGSFYQQFRIMLLEKEIAYGGEKNQYREISTGTVRTTSSYDERVVKAETYYFDREMHEAMDNMCRHDDITINSKSYIAKGTYEPNIDQLSKISKGEVELIDQEFSQLNS